MKMDVSRVVKSRASKFPVKLVKILHNIFPKRVVGRMSNKGIKMR